MKKVAYEQLAELERSHWWFRGRRAVYLPLIESALRSNRPQRILDIGAGVGGFLEQLRRMGGKLYFTEFEAHSARRAAARQLAPGVRSRAEHLPFVESSIDLACLFDVIEHVPEDMQALREVQRILKPGGVIAISVPAHPWLYSRNDEVAGHIRRYTRASLVELVQSAGFEIQRCTYTNSLLFLPIAAALLWSKLIQRFFPKAMNSEHTNLSWKVPARIDQVLFRCFRADLRFARQRDLVVGHSLLLIAKKHQGSGNQRSGN